MLWIECGGQRTICGFVGHTLWDGTLVIRHRAVHDFTPLAFNGLYLNNALNYRNAYISF